MKRVSNFQNELCLIFAGGALIASLQDIMVYDLPPLLLLLSYCFLACIPLVLHKYSLMRILYFLLLPLLFAAFYILFPVLSGAGIKEFYARFLKLALKTFQDELARYPAPFPALTLGGISLLLFYALTLLKRFRLFLYLIMIIPAALIISSPWTGKLEGITIVLLSSSSLLSAVTFLYVRRRFNTINTGFNRIQLQFFAQNLIFSLLICSALTGLSQIQLRAPKEPLWMRLSSKESEEKRMERASYLIIQDDDLVMDLSSNFNTSTQTAVELLSHTPLYLVEEIYSFYDGKSWSRQVQDTQSALKNTEAIRNISGTRDSRPLKITYKGLKTESLLYPPYLLRIDSVDKEMLKERDFSYTADVFSPPENLWKTINSSESAKELLEYNDQLDITIPPRISKLAHKITEDYPTPYGKVKALENYLRGELLYSTRPPKAPEDNDLTEYFLFESGKGFCIHFASALALMAQAEGIPSRVVSGYVANRGSLRTDSTGRHLYTIPFSQAHAWTEVYLPPAGWIPMDATPRYLALYEQTYSGPSPEAEESRINENNGQKERPLPIGVLMTLLVLAGTILLPLILRISTRPGTQTQQKVLQTHFKKITTLTKMIKVPYLSQRTLKEYRYQLRKKLGEHSNTQQFLQQLEYIIYSKTAIKKENIKKIEDLYPICRKEIYPKSPLLPYLFYRYLNKI